MAKFTFQLDGVLRHHRAMEQQRQRDLALVQAKLQPLEARLRALDAEVRQTAGDVRQNHLTGPLDMNFLAAHRRYVAATQRQALALAQEMAAIQQDVNRAREALVEETKKRKVLESLREKHRERWLADVNRREFNAADDVAMQMSYRQAETQDEREASGVVSPTSNDSNESL